MIFSPHKYQQYAIDYIISHPISAVFLDMGLGKTVITLTAIKSLMFDYLEISKVLVVAPIRVAKISWPDEINKWEHLKDLKYSVVCGTQAERKIALNENSDIYIINRENIPWLIEQSGYNFDFDMLVIDELSSFKNCQAKRFKALMKVRPKVKRVVGLTATPSSNGLMDLFAEFRLLDMGERLGRYITHYRRTYFKPDKYSGAIVYSYKPLPYAEKEIYKKISDITISLTAKDYLKMPELVKTYFDVKLDNKEHQIIKKLKTQYTLSLSNGEITASTAAVVTGKLIQLSNGAIYDDDGKIIDIHEKKLDALEDLIESMNGKSALVAYWYKHDLERIEKRLDKIGVTYARLDNEDNIRLWNSNKLDVGLIHPASAGHGLNLQAGGSTLIWYSLIYSLELYQQTIGRIYRQGQKNSTVICHIIAKGTIDEKIVKVLDSKNKMQTDLIDAVKAELEV